MKAVRILAKGYLPISLITPYELQEIINLVKETLIKSNPDNACSKNLPNISCHPQLHLEIPKVRFACIAIDTIGKVPTTSSGNR